MQTDPARFCSRCGSQLSGDASFCSSCGASSGDTSPHQQMQAASSPAVSTSPLAIVALVAGIVGWLFCFLGGPLAIPIGLTAVICGHVGKAQIRKTPEALTGAGLATAGLWLGYTMMVLSILVPILAIGGASIFGDEMRQFFGSSADDLAGY